MSGEHSTTVVDGPVLTVTLSRPDKLNAISPEITAALWDAVRRLRAEPDLRVMVIRATGEYFTAGLDLKAAGSAADVDPEAVDAGAAYRSRLREHHLLYDELEAVEKPVVLAAQGPCIGAGVEMALSCDVRLATPQATFGLPEIRFGVLPGSGGISRLTRLVGPGWTRWMAMAGETVDAERALAIGLIHEVVASEELDERVRSAATGLAGLPAESVGLAKLVIDASDATDRATARDLERIANTRLNFTPEFQERLRQFRRGPRRGA